MNCDRLFTDPEDVCVCCSGLGALRFFDADCGYSYEPCNACEALATTGVYVVRLVVGFMTFEQSWHSASFEIAVARAERWAQLARYFGAKYDRAAEVRAVFLPTDPDQGAETVHAARVWEPTATFTA